MAKAKKTAPVQDQSHHFFATTAVSWATGRTRAEAIQKAARIAGASLIKQQVKAFGGLYCWSVKVDMPPNAKYTINFYRPEFITIDGEVTEQRVPISDAIEARIIDVKGNLKIED